jgi:hypothetical protein
MILAGCAGLNDSRRYGWRLTGQVASLWILFRFDTAAGERLKPHRLVRFRMLKAIVDLEGFLADCDGERRTPGS